MVESITVHPQYDSRSKKNDIALLRLASNVTFTDFITPICLPIEYATMKANLNEVPLIVTGWGKSESAVPSKKKLQVELSLFPKNECREKYESIKLPKGYDPIKINDDQVRE